MDATRTFRILSANTGEGAAHDDRTTTEAAGEAQHTNDGGGDVDGDVYDGTPAASETVDVGATQGWRNVVEDPSHYDQRGNRKEKHSSHPCPNIAI